MGLIGDLAEGATNYRDCVSCCRAQKKEMKKEERGREEDDGGEEEKEAESTDWGNVGWGMAGGAAVGMFGGGIVTLAANAGRAVKTVVAVSTGLGAVAGGLFSNDNCFLKCAQPGYECSSGNDSRREEHQLNGHTQLWGDSTWS